MIFCIIEEAENVWLAVNFANNKNSLLGAEKVLENGFMADLGNYWFWELIQFKMKLAFLESDGNLHVPHSPRRIF